MSSSDIISHVWEGSLKAEFTLDGSDTLYYTVLPRNSYLHLQLKDILSYYETTPELDTVWFECEGIPLKWSLPIGILYEQTHPQQDEVDQTWKISIKQGANYPSGYIMPIEPDQADGMKFLKRTWMNQMKEVCYILNGSSKIMLSLSKQETDHFYHAVEERDPENFEKTFRKLLPSNVANVHNIPVKIHLPLANKIVQPSLSKVSRQLTVGKLLQQQIPDLFPSNLMVTIASPVCQGVVLPLDVPVLDLYMLLKYMDGFLHITIRMIQRGTAN